MERNTTEHTNDDLTQWQTIQATGHEAVDAEETLIFWFNRLRGVIIRNHPLLTESNQSGYIDHDDLHQDGFEPLKQALAEFDGDMWDENLGNFLAIRVRQRLMDKHRNSVTIGRRKYEILRLYREAQDTLGAEGESVTFDECMAYMKAKGWPNWLGVISAEKVKEALEVQKSSTFMTSLDETNENLDDEVPSIQVADPTVDVEAEVIGLSKDPTLRHVVGLDLQVLTDPCDELFELINERAIEAGGKAQSRAVWSRHAKDYSLHGLALLRGLPEAWVGVTVAKCSICGMVWPIKSTNESCGRLECLLGNKQIPDPDFQSFEFWRELMLEALSKDPSAGTLTAIKKIKELQGTPEWKVLPERVQEAMTKWVDKGKVPEYYLLPLALAKGPKEIARAVPASRIS